MVSFIHSFLSSHLLYLDMEDLDSISTRTLALTRYKRNHEIMNEVFQHAAFGERNATAPPTPYSIFNKDELQAKIVSFSWIRTFTLILTCLFR